MSFSTELFIGFRQLRSRSKLAFVSLTTWISVLGIALGVATLIVVVGVMTGFQREFRDKILGTQSHIVITKSGASLMRNWRDVLKNARNHEGVVAGEPFRVRPGDVLVSRTVCWARWCAGLCRIGNRRDGHQKNI